MCAVDASPEDYFPIKPFILNNPCIQTESKQFEHFDLSNIFQLHIQYFKNDNFFDYKNSRSLCHCSSESNTVTCLSTTC